VPEIVGNEYKAERKILLKNLSGNSSWKNGAPEKEEQHGKTVKPKNKKIKQAPGRRNPRLATFHQPALACYLY